jgi:hypothetical protein
MKLSNETLSVLKNFAGINQGLQFKQGKQLSTISANKTVFATAVLKDEFPQEFCVYDLNQFLSVHSHFQSLYKDAEIDFDDVNIILKSGRSKTSYRKTAKHMITVPPDKTVTLPSVDVSFILTEDIYSAVLKSASLLGCPHVSVESDGENIYITNFNASDDSAHTNSIEVSEGNGNKFKMVFLVDNLKMISGSYDVEISSKGIASFKNKNTEIQYWVAIEAKFSKFGE